MSWIEECAIEDFFSVEVPVYSYGICRNMVTIAIVYIITHETTSFRELEFMLMMTRYTGKIRASSLEIYTSTFFRQPFFTLAHSVSIPSVILINFVLRFGWMLFGFSFLAHVAAGIFEEATNSAIHELLSAAGGKGTEPLKM